MFLQMLCATLRSVAGVEVVATGTSLSDAQRLAACPQIDLVVLDACLAGQSGFDLLRIVRERHPALRCVVLTDASCVYPPELGDSIVGVVGKSESCSVLLSAVAKAGGAGDQAVGADFGNACVRAQLTSREYEVFDGIGRGLSNKEIARALNITVRTVETHRKAVSRKLGQNGAALVRLATLSRGLALP